MQNLYPSGSLDFGPHLDIAAHSTVGVEPSVRPENQDNLLLIDAQGRAVLLRNQRAEQHQVPDWPPGQVRLAVLDGMGGHGQGREVAEAVAAGLLSIPACASQGELNLHMDAMHNSLQRHFPPAPETGSARRPGTTITLLELRPGQPALLYHVGDSRLYALSREEITPLTVDHVPATTYAMAGLISESEWWQQVHAEHRSQISQAFILGNAFANPSMLSDPLYELTPLNLPGFLYHLADRRAIPLYAGVTYLLATDGFWACRAPADWVARWPELLGDCHSAQALIDRLFSEMETHPPPYLHADNLTAIALRFSP